MRQLLKKGWIWESRESREERAAETLDGEARALGGCFLANRGFWKEQSLAGYSRTPTGLRGRSPIGYREPRNPALGRSGVRGWARQRGCLYRQRAPEGRDAKFLES